jgi:hypothetical protein
MEAIALLTGVVWKIYDDYADNKDAYSFLNTVELPLEIIVVVLSMAFAFIDNMFLLYLLIIIISDCVLYILKTNDETFNVNYAVDTNCWKLGGIFAYCLVLFRIHSILTNFTVYDYGFILLGIGFISLEIYSQYTKAKEIIENEKENHLFLEASNQKFFTRILELILFMLFYFFVIQHYECARNFKYPILFALSYMSVSIVSILYLKYYYFYREGKPMFAK